MCIRDRLAAGPFGHEESTDALVRGKNAIIHSLKEDNSVGEVANVQILCEDDGETYVEANVPLDKVVVDFPEGHTNHIKLTDEVGVIMSYPDMNEMYKGIGEDQNTIDFSLELIRAAIAQVYEGEVVHERVDFTDEELSDFLESLTSEQFSSIQNFFETMPRVSHTVTVTNPNTKNKNKIKLEGLNSFFV